MTSADAKSRSAFDRALKVFPDGTTRVTVDRDPAPLYVSRGEGCWLYDLEGRRHLDLHGNFTVLINGHAYPPVVEAVTRQLRDGTCFANPTLAEVALAELICERVPGLDKIRFVNTGTEAVMFAVKAARAFTGRPAIAKIEGAYHGAYDWVEVSQTGNSSNWGPPDSPASIPYYAGMPASVPADVVTLRFNDPEGAARLIAKHANRLAAVVLDVMPSRIGLMPADRAFLEVVERTARQHGILIIADEVLSFRLGFAGASTAAGLNPDLWTLGKIIGGGFPIGAVGGREDVMAMFARRDGSAAVPQGGTFSANPVSMVAGLAGMTALTPARFRHLDQLGRKLRSRMQAALDGSGVELCITGANSLLRVHAKAAVPRDYREAQETPEQRARIARMVAHFRREGLLAPATGMICLSCPMGDAEVTLVAEAFASFLDAERALASGQTATA